MNTPYADGVTLISNRPDKNTGEMITKLHINPNKSALIDDDYVNTFKEIRQEMRFIKELCEYKNEYIARVDFRIDNYKDSYEDFYKINKIVVLLLANALNLKNQWSSIEPMKLTPKTIRAQDGCYEVEYYDRWIKTNREGLTRARLELRNKGLECQVKDIPRLINQWRDILSSLPAQYEQLQAEQNNVLLQYWEELKLNNTAMTMAGFVFQNQEHIYTVKQLAKLLELMGATNPKDLAYKYNYRFNFEFITRAELTLYINKIKRALMEFRG